MKINEVKINGFGKLTDRGFKFGKGLNVIYGPNEAGKSTLHQFIFAMLYGFYKPYMKRKQMNEAYDKYMPWQSSADYRGSMMLETEEGTYRIERTFTKGKDDVKVYDDRTGSDVTDRFDYNSAFKTYDPAKKLIGLNSVGFSNTVSISQLSSKTDEELVQEIQDNMSTLASTKQVEISVGNVLKTLDERADKIGSARKKTSAYALQKASLVSLEEEMAEARAAHEEAFGKKKEEVAVSGELAKLRERQKELQQQYAALKRKEYGETLTAVTKLQERQAVLMEIQARTEKYAEYKVESAEGFMRRKMELKNLAEKEKEQTAVIEKMVAEQTILRAEMKEKIGARDQAVEFEIVNDTTNRVENLDSVVKEKRTKIDAAAAMLDETKAKREALKPSQYLPYVIGGGAVAIVALVIGQLLSIAILTAVLMPVGLAVAGYFGYRMKNSQEEFKKEDARVRELEAVLRLSERDMTDDKKLMRRLIEDQGCEDLEALKAKRDKLYKESILADERKKRADELNEKLGQMDIDILEKKRFLKETKTRIIRLNDELEVTERVFGVKTEEDSRAASLAYQEYISASHELTMVKNRLKELLNGMHVSDLERKMKEVSSVDVEGLDIEEVNRELQAIGEEILAAAEKRTRLTAEIFNIEERHRTVGEIADEMVTVKISLRKMDEMLKVTEIISSNIREIAEEMQNDFAPLVNEKMSEVAGKVTGGKYTSLKVNPNMAVKLYDSSADRMVSVDELSSGTIDMVYLALRMGVSELLAKGRELPLILDDCFVQYDDSRIREVLDYLCREERQILLFTCHRREGKILDELGIDYEKIEV